MLPPDVAIPRKAFERDNVRRKARNRRRKNDLTDLAATLSAQFNGRGLVARALAPDSAAGALPLEPWPGRSASSSKILQLMRHGEQWAPRRNSQSRVEAGGTLFWVTVTYS